MTRAKDESGFSLMEVTIALAVMTVIMGTAFLLINKFQQSYRYEEAYADAQRNARFAMGRLAEIIRTAGTNPTGDMVVNGWRFVEFGNGGSFPTGGTLSNGDSLRLRSDLNGDKQSTATVSSNSDVIVTSENVTLKYESDNRRIVMIDLNAPSAAAGTIPLADNISSLRFSDPDGTRRDVLVQLVATPSGVSVGDPRYREVRYSSTIRLRNRR